MASSTLQSDAVRMRSLFAVLSALWSWFWLSPSDAGRTMTIDDFEVACDDRVTPRCATGDVMAMALVNRCASVQVDDS